MITGIIHPGSGLGDQLFTYILTRVTAEDGGYDFGFIGKEFFKGKDFMSLDFGQESDIGFIVEENSGAVIPEQGHTIFKANNVYYDPEVRFIQDGTLIDGCTAQDQRYFDGYLNKIRKWLSVEPLEVDDNLCVINFRGGEFTAFPELFLTKDYWEDAIALVLAANPKARFEVHTDDPDTAKQIFPFECIRNIGLNWRSVRFAKYAILSNSAFGIIPSLLNENSKMVVAPRYWARRNVKEWAMPQNYYQKFYYL